VARSGERKIRWIHVYQSARDRPARSSDCLTTVARYITKYVQKTSTPDATALPEQKEKQQAPTTSQTIKDDPPNNNGFVIAIDDTAPLPLTRSPLKLPAGMKRHTVKISEHSNPTSIADVYTSAPGVYQNGSITGRIISIKTQGTDGSPSKGPISFALFDGVTIVIVKDWYHPFARNLKLFQQLRISNFVLKDNPYNGINYREVHLNQRSNRYNIVDTDTPPVTNMDALYKALGNANHHGKVTPISLVAKIVNIISLQPGYTVAKLISREGTIGELRCRGAYAEALTPGINNAFIVVPTPTVELMPAASAANGETSLIVTLDDTFDSGYEPDVFTTDNGAEALPGY